MARHTFSKMDQIVIFLSFLVLDYGGGVVGMCWWGAERRRGGGGGGL